LVNESEAGDHIKPSKVQSASKSVMSLLEPRKRAESSQSFSLNFTLALRTKALQKKKFI